MGIRNNNQEQETSIDLLGVLRELGAKGIGKKIYKIARNMHNVYGSRYVIETARRFAANPRAYGLSFPIRLGKIYVIKYSKRLFDSTQDKNYIEGISCYTQDADERVSWFAKRTLEDIFNDAEFCKK